MLHRKRHSNASNNVTKWKTENLKDSSQKLNDEFTVRFGEFMFQHKKGYKKN
jgi:hypothetical protein